MRGSPSFLTFHAVARAALLLALLAVTALPANAAKRVTVAQLEETLTRATAAHKKDEDIARQVASMELSERLTDRTLGRLNTQFASGSQPAMALLLLADRSAFLDPPANELPTTPTPDPATQQKMLEAARGFAVDTLPNLPNLLATRTTFNFDDSPQEVTKGGYLQRIGLHLIGSSKTEVSVRNERKNLSVSTGAASSPTQGGLMTWGEFGSTLLILLSDSAQGTTAWSHWEQTASGVVAVFHYEVPRTVSHYEIDTPVEHVQPNGGSNRWARTGGLAAMTASSKNATVHSKPGYQGSLWIDPATGTILRLTLVADLKGNSTIERGATLVEYGPVAIAGKTVICPVRSLALSSAPATVNTNFEGAATEWLNENLFTDYHIFASTSRILDEQSAASPVPPAPPGASAPNQEAPPVAAQNSRPETEPAAPAPQQAAPPSVNLPSSVPASVEKLEPPAPDAPTNPNPVLSDSRPATTALPATAPANAANQPQPSSTPPVSPRPEAGTLSASPPLQINVSRVLVPVVVHDKQGRMVGDLQRGDFQVFDNGKPSPLSAFTVERRTSAGNSDALAAEPKQHPSSQADAAKQSAILPDRVTVLLFDDLHLTFEDLAYVRKAASNALDETLGGSDVAAVVSVSGKINSGLTRDRAKLHDAMMSLQPQGIYRASAADCPKIDYYQADLIENRHDPAALNDVIGQIMTVCSPNTPKEMAERLAETAAMHSLSAGRQDVLKTYETLREIVRRMAPLTGQRSLLLVSDGFLPVEEEARYAESQAIDLAVQSNVIINAVDARGLYTASISASDDTRGRSPGQVAEYRRSSMSIEEEAMGELADGTGGTFFHDNNDLDAGFKTIAEAPEFVYMLELPLDGMKANGAYHRLEVKVDRKGIEVQARRGYFMPKPEKKQ